MNRELILRKIQHGREMSQVGRKVAQMEASSLNDMPEDGLDIDLNIVRVMMGDTGAMILREEVRRKEKDKTVLLIWDNCEDKGCYKNDLTDYSEESISDYIYKICSEALKHGEKVTISSMGE